MGKMEKKIMVVDDDPDILVTLRNFLEHQGFEVLTVDSGNDCIEELKRGFKGVVLMDLLMPFMDGIDTLKEIVRNGLNKDVTISIITANGTTDSERLKEIGPYIYTYITKPFDLKKLVSDIKGINN